MAHSFEYDTPTGRKAITVGGAITPVTAQLIVARARLDGLASETQLRWQLQEVMKEGEPPAP